MTREEEIKQAAQAYYPSGSLHEERTVSAFVRGAKWADENPDSKHTYTKQQLIDMGFTFTTNGDIVTPDQLNEDLKKYLKHHKQKFIDKTKEWLEKTLYIHTEIDEDEDWGIINSIDWVTSDYDSVEDFINSFCKVMEE